MRIPGPPSTDTARNEELFLCDFPRSLEVQINCREDDDDPQILLQPPKFGKTRQDEPVNVVLTSDAVVTVSTLCPVTKTRRGIGRRKRRTRETESRRCPKMRHAAALRQMAEAEAAGKLAEDGAQGPLEEVVAVDSEPPSPLVPTEGNVPSSVLPSTPHGAPPGVPAPSRKVRVVAPATATSGGAGRGVSTSVLSGGVGVRLPAALPSSKSQVGDSAPSPSPPLVQRVGQTGAAPAPSSSGWGLAPLVPRQSPPPVAPVRRESGSSSVVSVGLSEGDSEASGQREGGTGGQKRAASQSASAAVSRECSPAKQAP
uniref:Uncharacterized protein n=1 Tax=Chromera velia CCMP2878 TaxID=1169474 RepID=A0A0G4HKE5_9ALVE|eukprot:Cvel_28386.t1-p1 / transcript=Cvel_28386.t1 / gene=Cvel_28386 / organism=Chromera_velia_CCMP2878 / gene_product=hypothetical protein / transcript_product=hypothetical protein / location=Cvel_scaffold3706:3032-7339(-) / protein_length=313 / sequence_SO=supercontig / SO=protein_coding / is_pseudo=false